MAIILGFRDLLPNLSGTSGKPVLDVEDGEEVLDLVDGRREEN